MDKRLKDLLERELHHLETHAREFTGQGKFNELARRIGLSEGQRPRDPLVEWLLEGSAFLSARIQHQIKSEFPRLTRSLLSVVFPHLCTPTPSMVIAQLGFSAPGDVVLGGPYIERGAKLHMRVAPPRRQVRHTPRPDIIYSTGRGIRLWPAIVSEASYLPDPAALQAASGGELRGASGLEVRLALQCGESFADSRLDTMDIFFQSASVKNAGAELMTAMGLSPCEAGVVIAGSRRARGVKRIEVAPLGFSVEAPVEGHPKEDSGDALLPYDRRSYDGYRLLHEFFALPEKFQFIRISGLRAAFNEMTPPIKDNHGRPVATLVFAFNRTYPSLSKTDANSLHLNCVPAVNLFEKTADNTTFDRRRSEVHVVADRDRPGDFEVHSILEVYGNTSSGRQLHFDPFFSSSSLSKKAETSTRYYAFDRRNRHKPKSHSGDAALARDEKKSERGSEVFLTLVDQQSAPTPIDLQSLAIRTLCSNRHLPKWRGLGSEKQEGEVRLEKNLDVDEIIIREMSSTPFHSITDGRRKWDIISHLSLSHLSIMETEQGDPADAIRQLLRLYAHENASDMQRLIDTLTGVRAKPGVGRLSTDRMANDRPIPVVFARGVDIELEFDEEAPPQSVILASILDRFFAGRAPSNSFTRTSIVERNGKERIAWPNRVGLQTEF